MDFQAACLVYIRFQGVNGYMNENHMLIDSSSDHETDRVLISLRTGRTSAV